MGMQLGPILTEDPVLGENEGVRPVPKHSAGVPWARGDQMAARDRGRWISEILQAAQHYLGYPNGGCRSS